MDSKVKFWSLVILFSLVTILVLSSNVLGLTPFDDSSANGYTLSTTGTITYNNTNQSWNSIAAGYLNSSPNNNLNNFSVEIHFWRNTLDTSTTAQQGLFMLGNGTLSSQHYLVVSYLANSSNANWGRITTDARNITNSTSFLTNSGTNSYLRNRTNHVNLTITVRGTNVSTFIDGTYRGYSTLPGGFSSGAITKFYIMRADSYYLNGSVDYFKVTNLATNTIVAEYRMQNTTCTTPTENLYLNTPNTEVELCTGTYTLNASSKTNILVNATNVTVDCNGATIQGDYRTNFTIGFQVSKSNATIKNCNLKGYGSAVQITYYTLPSFIAIDSFNLTNNNISRMGGVASIYSDGLRKIYATDNRFFDNNDYYERDIGSHFMYYSCGNSSKCIIGGYIARNYMYNSSASGIKFNGASVMSNVLIEDNDLINFNPTQGDDIGVHLAETQNITVRNNYFKSPMDSAVVLNIGTNVSMGAHNNLIENNIFNGTTNGIWTKNGAYNNTWRNNTCISCDEHIRFGTTTSMYIEETSTIRMGDGYGDYWFNGNFTGAKNFTLRSNNLTIYDPVAPYNDLWNGVAVIAYDIPSGYTLAMSDSSYYYMGSYGTISPPTSSILSPSANSTWGSVVNFSVKGTAYNNSNIGRLYINGVLNNTNSNLANNTLWNFNVSFTVGGSYIAEFEFCDAFGTCANTTTVNSFNVIIPNPITVTEPTTGDDINQYLNISWEDLNSGLTKFYNIYLNSTFLGNYSTNWSLINEGTNVFTNPYNAFDSSAGTFANSSTTTGLTSYLGKMFAGGLYINNITIESYITQGGSSTSWSITLEVYNGSSWVAVAGNSGSGSGGSLISTTSINDIIYGVRVELLGTASRNWVGQVYNLSLDYEPFSLLNLDTYALNLPIGSYVINVSAYNSSNGFVASDISGIFDIVSNAFANISVFNYTGGSQVANITLTDLTTLLTQNVFNNGALFNIIKDRAYSLRVAATDYSTSTNTVTFDSFGTNYLNISLNPTNAINLSIYDLDTGNLITENLSVTVTAGTVRAFNSYTGNILLTNLAVGLNEIKVSNINYSEARFSVVVADGSYTNLSVYLTKSNLSSEVEFTFYNPNGAIIEGVLVGEYVLVDSDYVLIMSGYTDISGKVYFSYNDDYSYTYFYSKEGYVSNSFILNPPREATYDITLQFASSGGGYSLPQVTGSASFNNVTDIVSFTYQSTNSSYSNYSYTLSKIVDSSAIVICSGSSDLTYDVFYCDVGGYSGTVYIQGVVDGQIFYGSGLNLGGVNKLSDQVEPRDASLWIGLILLTVVVAATFLGVFGALIFLVGGLLVLSWIGLLSVLTITIVIIVAIVSAVISFGLRRY